MSEVAMTYERDGYEFQWHGGAYIEIGYTATEDSHIRNNEGIPSHSAGEFVAGEVINVWDYAADEPTIGRDLHSFRERCDEWLAGEDEDEDEDE